MVAPSDQESKRSRFKTGAGESKGSGTGRGGEKIRSQTIGNGLEAWLIHRPAAPKRPPDMVIPVPGVATRPAFLCMLNGTHDSRRADDRPATRASPAVRP